MEQQTNRHGDMETAFGMKAVAVVAAEKDDIRPNTELSERLLFKNTS